MGSKNAQVIRTERIDRLARDLARAIVERWEARDAQPGRVYMGVIERTGGGLVLKVFTKAKGQLAHEETGRHVTPRDGAPSVGGTINGAEAPGG